MMHGGSYESSPETYENQLHVFDFNTMSWSKAKLSETMGYRTGHMAACHNGNMIIMGGRQRRLGGCQPNMFVLNQPHAECLCRAYHSFWQVCLQPIYT